MSQGVFFLYDPDHARSVSKSVFLSQYSDPDMSICRQVRFIELFGYDREALNLY